MMNNHIITIHYDSQTPEYVSEFELHVQKDDTITFQTDETTSAAIVLPFYKRVFDDDKHRYPYQEYVLTKSDSKTTPPIRKDLQKDTAYTYHVYCIEAGQFADNPGSSAPKIIIDG